MKLLRSPTTSVQPEAPDALLEALRGASIVEEHRTLMGTMFERIRSAKSGLTKACTSLLTGFDVSNVKKNITVSTVAPDALSAVRKEKPNRGSNNFRRSLI